MTSTTTTRKSAAPAKASKSTAPKPSDTAPISKPAKHKLVRDSFTIPKSEYAVLEGLKLRATNLTQPAKKSELLRAGISALNAMSDKAFLAALSGIPSLKTGRPKAAETSVTAAKKTR